MITLIVHKLENGQVKQQEKSQKIYQEYQTFLLSNDLVVADKDVGSCFIVNLSNYFYNYEYVSGHKFNKYYYPKIGDLKNKGEEFECAQFIDSLDEIEYWVRNTERKKNYFWLQTSTDKFYPDFVCLLKDGRYLVIEYKGSDRWSDDDSGKKENQENCGKKEVTGNVYL